ncbi:MAG TPA: hypothetical protein VER17_15215 [Tepidisphaeraceae bacterium]|nr:hypothetical protein [Tepidisphaeraceae bacterium]
MLNEQLEFQVSQYADGTLPAAEVAALEAVLASDVGARELLAEYRSVDAALKREMSVPAMNWDRLAAHLSDAVAAENDVAPASPRTLAFSGWWARTGVRTSAAIAAMVLVAVGTFAILSRDRGTRQDAPVDSVVVNSQAQTALPTAVAIIDITGPAPEAAAGPAVAEITIDATPLAKQMHYGAAETIVYRAPRVVIASGGSGRQDVPSLPY